MEVGRQPHAFRFTERSVLSEPSYDAGINVNSLTWAGTTVGATAGPIRTTALVTADWPLAPVPKEDLASDPRLEDVPATLLRQATLLDPPKPFPAYYLSEPVQQVKTATLKLDASALTRLITLVDTDEVWAGNSYALVDPQVVSKTQTRRWFQNWNSVVAPATLAGGLTRARLLELLREARRRLRGLHTPRPRPITTACRIRDQLDLLANFISPHAPPYGPLSQRPTGAAAFHLTALA
jgi:hypothetical protein